MPVFTNQLFLAEFKPLLINGTSKVMCLYDFHLLCRRGRNYCQTSLEASGRRQAKVFPDLIDRKAKQGFILVYEKLELVQKIHTQQAVDT